MPEFSCDLSKDEIIDPTVIDHIVSSKDYSGEEWLEKTKHKLFKEPQLKKYFIPVDFSYWNLELVTIVDPGTGIPKHTHTEPVYRYIMDGSFELNGEEFQAGEWIIVPANFAYNIKTKTGYKIISRYHEKCEECTWKRLASLPLEKL